MYSNQSGYQTNPANTQNQAAFGMQSGQQQFGTSSGRPRAPSGGQNVNIQQQNAYGNSYGVNQAPSQQQSSLNNTAQQPNTASQSKPFSSPFGDTPFAQALANSPFGETPFTKAIAQQSGSSFGTDSFGSQSNSASFGNQASFGQSSFGQSFGQSSFGQTPSNAQTSDPFGSSGKQDGELEWVPVDHGHQYDQSKYVFQHSMPSTTFEMRANFTSELSDAIKKVKAKEGH
jgi:hypothetical protein